MMTGGRSARMQAINPHGPSCAPFYSHYSYPLLLLCLLLLSNSSSALILVPPLLDMLKVPAGCKQSFIKVIWVQLSFEKIMTLPIDQDKQLLLLNVRLFGRNQQVKLSQHRDKY